LNRRIGGGRRSEPAVATQRDRAATHECNQGRQKVGDRANDEESKMSQQPLDRADLLRDLAAGDHQCTARSKRTGKRCQLPSMLGSNVCRSHGGAAPQARAKAKRRLDQAADVLVQRLLQFALDGNVDDNVALRAIRDALDRAGLKPRAQVEVSAKPPEPWEELMGDVLQITKAQHDAIYHPERTAPAPALSPPDVLDAEVVPEAPETQPDSPGERADGAGQAANPRPDFAEPSKPPSRELATLEDAAAEVAQANRAARVVRVRRRR
jgi:hypothetical protein